jgi:hypothetical protein
MTLDTRILIKNPHSVQEVYDFCNRDLLRVEDPERAPWPSPHVSAEWIAQYYPAGLQKMGNQLGQGLSAILDISYMADGPFTADYMAGEYLPDSDEKAPLGAELTELLTGSMEVSFDTAYGYRRGSAAGAGCGDLHAYFVLRLAQQFGPVVWLDECGGDWFWLNLDDPEGQLEDQLDLLNEKLGDPDLGARDVAATPFRTKTKSEPLR